MAKPTLAPVYRMLHQVSQFAPGTETVLPASFEVGRLLNLGAIEPVLDAEGNPAQAPSLDEPEPATVSDNPLSPLFAERDALKLQLAEAGNTITALQTEIAGLTAERDAVIARLNAAQAPAEPAETPTA